MTANAKTSTEVSSEDALEIRRSKRLRGSAALPGDAQSGYHALFLASLAHGASKLDNLPESPWFRETLENYSRLGYAQPAPDGAWFVHGGNAPVTEAEPLRVRHEIEWFTLAGLLAGARCGRPVEIDPGRIPQDAQRALRRLLISQDGAPSDLDPKVADACRPAAAPCRPGERGWEEYPSKLILLSYHLAAGKGLDLALAKGGPDSLETLAVQFGVPLRVQNGAEAEGDELARRIARQLRAAGKHETLTRITLSAGAKLKPLSYSLPGDVSETAALCLAATLIKGSDITLENVLLNPSRTGFLAALRRMGADIETISRRERHGETVGTLRVRSAELIGKRFGSEALAGMRDEIFLLMIATAFAEGESIVRDIGHLRGYPADLLKEFSTALKLAGVEIGEIEDGLILRGRNDYDGGEYDGLGHPALGLAYLVMGVKSHGASTLTGCSGLENRFPGLAERMLALTEEKT